MSRAAFTSARDAFKAGAAIAMAVSAIIARQHTEIVSEAMREFGRSLHSGAAKVRM